VYQPFHCLFGGYEEDRGGFGDEETTGAEDPSIAPAVEDGEVCGNAASVGPPDADIEDDCQEEVGVASCGVE